MDELTNHPAATAARARARALAAEAVRLQLELVRIPAPSGAEAERGARVCERLAALLPGPVEVDEVGNVIARATEGEPGAPPVVVAAHLDTVFAAETPIEPRHRGGRYWAPGITDNARGLAALLVLGRVLAELGVRTRRPVVLVATVGEEGAGDLRGVKHLFRDGSAWREAAAVIALDGSGVTRVVHRAIGSRRLRFEVAGPGGHSWSDWGAPNPLAALGSAMHALQRLELPEEPPAALTVARAGGGTSINSIPADAWMELDLRSEDPALLRQMEESARAAVEGAVRAENDARRRGTLPLLLQARVIGDRPAGVTPPDHPLVRWAVAATRAVGAQAELVGSSTDANAPIACGIGAVAIGAGGRSGGVHTLQEWYDDATGAEGLERALLLVLAAAGLRA